MAQRKTMRVRGIPLVLSAIALLSVGRVQPASAQLNVIRRARQLRTEQEERRTGLEQQAEDLTGSGSSTPSRPSGSTSGARRSQPVAPRETVTRQTPTIPVSPPGSTTGTQPAASEIGSDAVPGLTPEEQYDKSLASWHVSRNVCNRNWSVAEFNRLFPRIDDELTTEVCDR